MYSMTQKIKLLLALQQTENIYELIRGNQYEGFFASHLLNVKYELERQITNLTRAENCSKLER
jgi:predicted RNA-binding protein with EMAP domain